MGHRPVSIKHGTNRFYPRSQPDSGGGGGGPPTGPAGGDLTGTYPDPQVIAITEAAGTDLAIAAIDDGNFLVRSGATITAQTASEMALAHVAITDADSPYSALSTDGIIGTNTFVSHIYEDFKDHFSSKHPKKPKVIQGLHGVFSLKRLSENT